MYLVKIYDGPGDNKGVTIHSPYVSGAKLSSGEVTLKLSGINEFTFSFNSKNPGYRKIEPYRSLIKVIDTKRKKTLFDGRVIKPRYSMSQNGMFTDSYFCESKLAYLHDSSQRYAKVRDTTIRDFFVMMIDRHNKTVEPHKRFKAGNVTVANNTDNVYRYLGYEKTYPTIKDKLIDRLGGFLVLREENDEVYIDYLESVGSVVEEPKISIRKNLKSISRDVDPTSVITRLVPLGKTLDDEEGDGSAVSQPRLTIESVNNGIDYLDDLALQREFGIIEGEVTWEDVTLPSNLLIKGREFFENQRALLETLEIDAIDLSLLGLEINSFNIGYWYYIDNPYIAPYEPWQIIEKTIDITTPQNSKLTLGDKRQTLTQYQANFNKSKNNVVELQRVVSRVSTRVSTTMQNVADTQNTITTIQETLDKAGIENIEEFKQETSNQLNSLFDNITEIGREVIEFRAEFDRHVIDFDRYKEVQAQEIQTINERLDRLEKGGEEPIG